MDRFIQLFILVPLAGLILSLLVNKTRELTISRISYVTVGLNLLLTTLFAIFWILKGAPPLNIKEITIYREADYEFMIELFCDSSGMVFLWVGAFLSFLVTLYSRVYMHRERHYKRFFNTILFFYLGFNIIILSGNFETLFMGWEILGTSSFLLISFYRERFIPVKNALKVYSIYRIGDLGIILVMWLSHHVWHRSVGFAMFNDSELMHAALNQHALISLMMAAMILLSAAVKSAMFPFTSWLPRAMEGPTPSSAIFYGSLSVHMGVFLLLRTYPIWEGQLGARWLIGITGLVTALVSGLTARVQTSVKGQIAYASSAQLGLIFIEMALGLQTLVLIHFAGNAFLRTYQLLISPSVVNYLIRDQFYNFIPRRKTIEDKLPKRLQYTLYILSLKEWNLDWFMSRAIWRPLKWIGRMVMRIRLQWLAVFFGLIIVSTIIFYDKKELLPPLIFENLPEVIGLLGLMAVLRSFAVRKSPYEAWGMLLVSHVFVVLSVSLNERFSLPHSLLYLSGIIAAGIAGLAILGFLDWKERRIDLENFYGHGYHYPLQSFLFLLCAIAIAGFPITPTFIGEDLIYSHIEANQAGLALILSLIFIVSGISAMRIYARLFMSMPVRRFHEVGYRSS